MVSLGELFQLIQLQIKDNHDYQGINIEINKIVLRLFTIDARKAVITLKKVASLVTIIAASFSLQKLKKKLLQTFLVAATHLPKSLKPLRSSDVGLK